MHVRTKALAHLQTSIRLLMVKIYLTTYVEMVHTVQHLAIRFSLALQPRASLQSFKIFSSGRKAKSRSLLVYF